MPLHPQTRALLDQFAAAGGFDATQLPVPAVRELYAQMSLGRAVPAVASVADRGVAGPAGEIPVRVYAPVAGRALPGIVYFHGGGFVIGSLDTPRRHLPRPRERVGLRGRVGRLPARAGAPLPGRGRGLLRRDAAGSPSTRAELGVDPRRLAVGGDSAGGNLAAVIALLARERRGPRSALPAARLPGHRSRLRHARPIARTRDGYFLTAAMMRWFWDHYLERPEQGDGPVRLAAARAKDLAGLPPAPRDHRRVRPAARRGRGLRRAPPARPASPTELRRYDGQIHGFFSLYDALDDGRAALDHAGAALRAALA